jgi:hypothetical protein
MRRTMTQRKQGEFDDGFVGVERLSEKRVKKG